MNVFHCFLSMAYSLASDYLARRVKEDDDLVKLGAQVGYPYVPGEDLRAYRRRIMLLRDEEPHRFSDKSAA